MARIAPLGITLLLLLATCFFGFETRSKVQDLDNQLGQLGIQLNSSKQAVAKAQADLKGAQDDAAKAKADADSAKSQLATVQSNLDAANKQVADDKTSIADLTAKLAKSGTNQGPAPVVQNGPSQADMDKLTAQLKDETAQIAELNQVKDTLNTKAQDAESRANDLQKDVDRYKSHTVRNGLEGEVLAVNQGWNFVVLSIGDHQGAVTNAEMILKRGDSQIGKVRITSVEPSTSVADIIPGTLSRGVRVQPGDRVIFPGG